MSAFPKTSTQTYRQTVIAIYKFKTKKFSKSYTFIVDFFKFVNNDVFYENYCA